MDVHDQLLPLGRANSVSGKGDAIGNVQSRVQCEFTDMSQKCGLNDDIFELSVFE
jgi:hypothetical protein